MLHPRDIERYRAMTIEERLAETFELCDLDWAFLDQLPPEERARRLEIIERQHRESNEALLRALSRS